MSGSGFVIDDAALELATRDLFIGLTDHGDINSNQFHAMKDIARKTIITYLASQSHVPVTRRMERGKSLLTDEAF